MTRLALSLARSLKYQHPDVSAPSSLSPNPPPCTISFSSRTTRSPTKNWADVWLYAAHFDASSGLAAGRRPAARHNEPGRRDRIPRYMVRIQSVSSLSSQLSRLLDRFWGHPTLPLSYSQLGLQYLQSVSQMVKNHHLGWIHAGHLRDR